MKFYCFAAASLAVGACSSGASDQKMNIDENLVEVATPGGTTELVNESEAKSRPAPHNYVQREGAIYEYVSGVSEEDEKKGKAVGDVSLFAFRGVVGGVYRISSVDDGGRTQWYYECQKPCLIIKRYDHGKLEARVPYSPSSVIGSAFEDALNGQLQVSKEPARKQASAPTSQLDASDDYPSPQEPESVGNQDPVPTQ